MNKNCIIFDFDSTIVSIETLDFLLAKSQNHQKHEIEKITNLAMSGKMTFADSLRTRFSGISLTRSDIESLRNEICNYITLGFADFINNIKPQFDLYIISGGFLEIIYPVAEKLGIAKENSFANNFIYEGEKIIGYDASNILAQNGGKPKIVAQILRDKKYDKIFMVGDGYTDLEVAKSNYDVIFCGFGIHIARQSVRDEAKYFFHNIADLQKFVLE